MLPRFSDFRGVYQLVVELADVRVLAFGTLNRPRSTLTINPNAHMFLHPPGVDADDTHAHHYAPRLTDLVEDHGVYPVHDESCLPPYRMSTLLATLLPDHKYQFRRILCFVCDLHALGSTFTCSLTR
jgi:hypothetical protein